MSENLLRFYKGKYIVFDFETESLNLRFSRPWEVAWIAYDGEKTTRRSANILWKDIRLSDGAAAVTKFNKEDYLYNAEDPYSVLEEFNSYVYDPSYLILFYNGLNFDIYQHASWQMHLGKTHSWSYLSRAIDVHCIYKAYKFGYLEIDDLELWQRKLTSVYKKGVKTNLATMAKEFSIDVDTTKTHAGLYDSELTLLGFDQLKQRIRLPIPDAIK